MSRPNRLGSPRARSWQQRVIVYSLILLEFSAVFDYLVEIFMETF